MIVKSYGDELAEEHSREARRLIAGHPGLLGVELAQDKSAVGRWRVAGRRGGLLAGGILSSTTGFGASSLLVVDDPIKGAAEADRGQCVENRGETRATGNTQATTQCTFGCASRNRGTHRRFRGGGLPGCGGGRLDRRLPDTVDDLAHDVHRRATIGRRASTSRSITSAT